MRLYDATVTRVDCPGNILRWKYIEQKWEPGENQLRRLVDIESPRQDIKHQRKQTLCRQKANRANFSKSRVDPHSHAVAFARVHDGVLHRDVILLPVW